MPLSTGSDIPQRQLMLATALYKVAIAGRVVDKDANLSPVGLLGRVQDHLAANNGNRAGNLVTTPSQGNDQTTVPAGNKRETVLAQTLLDLLVALGMVRPDAAMSPPELLMAAETFVEETRPLTDAQVLQWMQDCTTLHRQVEMWYVVDGFQVSIYDDDRQVAGPWKAETLAEALRLAAAEYVPTTGRGQDKEGA